MFVGDGEREKGVATLREHFVRGRLTVEELSNRTERVLVARSRAELQTAFTGLPAFLDVRELAARGRSVADAAIRGVLLVILTGAYVLFSLALVLVLGLTLLIHGASTAALLGFLVVWLAPTYLLSRLWRRRPTRST
jgi:Flp pilus assembly protein TadB